MIRIEILLTEREEYWATGIEASTHVRLVGDQNAYYLTKQGSILLIAHTALNFLKLVNKWKGYL